MPTPDVIRCAERFHLGRPPKPPSRFNISAQYQDFLRTICHRTGTRQILPYVQVGLKHALSRARVLDMNQQSDDAYVKLYANTLMIHVWQVVCLRTLYSQALDENESPMHEFGSYTLAAHMITQETCTCSIEEFKHSLKYWENRLNNRSEQGLWRHETWLFKLPEIVLVRKSRNSIADAYLDALAKGKSYLATEIIDKDRTGQHQTPMRTYTTGSWAKKHFVLGELLCILASVDTVLLEALIDGSLAQKAEMPGHNVFKSMFRTSSVNLQPPSIYLNCICDRKGISPTPFHWQVICEKMLEYVASNSRSGDDLAYHVDQIIAPDVKWPRTLARQGLRRYTEWRTYVENDGDTYPDSTRRKMVKYFVSQMMARIKPQIDDGKGCVPLAAPVVNVGFSKNPTQRLKEHRNHQHSNYLMNLSEALFEYVYPGAFRLQQHVIFTCFSPAHPWFGEIIFTQLAQGYTEEAGGFSHHPAGRSNGSAYASTSRSEWAKFSHNATKSGVLSKELEKINNEARLAREAASTKLASSREFKSEVEDSLKRLENAMLSALDFAQLVEHKEAWTER